MFVFSFLNNVGLNTLFHIYAHHQCMQTEKHWEFTMQFSMQTSNKLTFMVKIGTRSIHLGLTWAFLSKCLISSINLQFKTMKKIRCFKWNIPCSQVVHVFGSVFFFSSPFVKMKSCTIHTQIYIFFGHSNILHRWLLSGFFSSILCLRFDGTVHFDALWCNIHVLR